MPKPKRLRKTTECRRAFENMLYGKGNTSYTYADLSEEIFSEMQSDELVEDIGRTAVCGKLVNEYQQYTYGAYLDSSAENLEYLKLAAGRFPTAAGEAALYDYILEDLFFTTEPASFIGREITLSQFNFGEGNSTGERVGEITLKIVGIIQKDELREQKEYLSGWIGYGNFSVKSMPVIYLFSGDCDITEQMSSYTLVRLKNDDILTEEQTEIALKDFLLKYNKKYKIVPSSRAGIKTAAQSVANFAVESENIQTRIYQSDTMTVIRYFSIIAVVISAISLFGILFSVMPERMKSLNLVRKIGCSKRQVAAIILTEWLFLLISGTVLGIAAGAVLYELILLIQSGFFGLSPLHGYTAEWAVIQVTDNPFISAIICAVCMFALGYAVYFARFLFKKKDRRKSGKVRSLRQILRKLSGNAFAKIMQILSLSPVLFAAVMCYSYFTIDGKGGGYFTDSELNGDAYYNCAKVNMRDSKTDICVYTSGNGCFGLAVVDDFGLPVDTADKIAQINGVREIQCFSVNTAFNLFYPKNSTEVPAEISRFYAELLKNADEMLHPNERDYYPIPSVFGNKTSMDRLSEFVTEGEIGSYENGLTMVLYERDGKAVYPYKIGDTVNSIAIDGGPAHRGHDMEFVIEAIAVIPETAKETAPITYAEFDFSDGLTFAAPQETAIQLNTYKEKFSNAYISLNEGADIHAVTQKIQKLLDSSMRVKLRTITECDEAYQSSYIARFASVIVLFAILVLMTIIGCYSIISMRLQISKPKIAVLRAVGLSEKKRGRAFLLQNVFGTIISCIIGTGLVYGLRLLIDAKYNEALACFGYPNGDLFGASAEVYKQVNDLNSTYLLSYEIQNAPVVLPLIVTSLALVGLSAVISLILLHGSKNESFISQMNNRTKE